MRVFDISPQASKSGVFVNATHKWIMPGIKCSACGTTWANTGLAYPGVDLSVLTDAEAYIDGWPVTYDCYKTLESRIRHLLPHKSLILPGTEFGPLAGEMKGHFDKVDCVWVNPWTLLIHRDFKTYLINAGVHLPMSINTELVYRSKMCSCLVELQIEARASMLPGKNTDNSGVACSICGYRPMTRTDPIVVREASLPDDVDLFRPIEFTTVILATERFMTACQDVEKSGFSFKDVQLI